MVKRILNSYISLVLILVAVGFVSYQLVEISYKKSQIKKRLPPLEEKIEKAKEKKENLSEMMDYYNTEAYLEKQARSKLNLKKEGEEVVIVVPPKKFEQAKKEGEKILGAQNISNTDEGRSQRTKTTNPQRWWQYFFERN